MNGKANATRVLILGILSIVCLPILGPFAWAMGNRALAGIDSGQVDPTQRGTIAAGRICGIVGTIVMVLAAAYAAFALTVGVRTMNLGRPAVIVRRPTSIGSGSTTIIHTSSIAGEQKRDALSTAILVGDTKQVTALLDSDPALANTGNMIGETPLFDAAFAGKWAIANDLINRGADVNATNKLGETALDKAVFFRHWDIELLLKKHGARRGKAGE